MFIQIEVILNFVMLKFLFGKVVFQDGMVDFCSVDEVVVLLFVVCFFGILGVIGVFFGYDFVIVIKEDQEWVYLKFVIFGFIMEYFMFGVLVMGGVSMVEVIDLLGEFYNEGDEIIVKMIKEFLEICVCLVVVQDGGDIIFCGFCDGKVFLNMKGFCVGCLFLIVMLKYGVQNLLCYFIFEVQEVEVV